jgi:hypothetical protein
MLVVGFATAPACPGMEILSIQRHTATLYRLEFRNRSSLEPTQKQLRVNLIIEGYSISPNSPFTSAIISAPVNQNRKLWYAITVCARKQSPILFNDYIAISGTVFYSQL